MEFLSSKSTNKPQKSTDFDENANKKNGSIEIDKLVDNMENENPETIKTATENWRKLLSVTIEIKFW